MSTVTKEIDSFFQWIWSFGSTHRYETTQMSWMIWFTVNGATESSTLSRMIRFTVKRQLFSEFALIVNNLTQGRLFLISWAKWSDSVSSFQLIRSFGSAHRYETTQICQIIWFTVKGQLNRHWIQLFTERANTLKKQFAYYSESDHLA